MTTWRPRRSASSSGQMASNGRAKATSSTAISQIWSVSAKPVVSVSRKSGWLDSQRRAVAAAWARAGEMVMGGGPYGAGEPGPYIGLLLAWRRRRAWLGRGGRGGRLRPGGCASGGGAAPRGARGVGREASSFPRPRVAAGDDLPRRSLDVQQRHVHRHRHWHQAAQLRDV